MVGCDAQPNLLRVREQGESGVISHTGMVSRKEWPLIAKQSGCQQYSYESLQEALAAIAAGSIAVSMKISSAFTFITKMYLRGAFRPHAFPGRISYIKYFITLDVHPRSGMRGETLHASTFRDKRKSRRYFHGSPRSTQPPIAAKASCKDS